MTMRELRKIPIPPSLRSGLSRLLRRYRRTVTLKGLSAALSVFLLGMFAVIALDRVFLMPRLLDRKSVV